VLATAAAGALAATFAHILAPLTNPTWTGSLLTLAAASLFGAITYVVAARLLRLTELRQLAATAIAGIRTS
jgi:hypothetical protein